LITPAFEKTEGGGRRRRGVDGDTQREGRKRTGEKGEREMDEGGGVGQRGVRASVNARE
jgi:hypothetical protein